MGAGTHYGAVRDRLGLGGASPLIVMSLVGSCAFGEVFSSAGPGDVQFVWVGPTEVRRDSAIAFQITLLIDGVPAATPAVQVAIPPASPTRITFGATQDSIVGIQPGPGEVEAWITSSLAARVDTVFTIQVRP